MPSNEGRGYVLRRIMRRAMRHAHMLGAREPLMWRLVPVLVAEMGQAFAELVRAEALITEVLRLEETRFREHARARPQAARRGDRRPLRGRRAARRDRVQALRHLRLPARSDRGRAARQGHDRRQGGVRGRDGAPARRGAGELEGLGRAGRGAHLVRIARDARRHRVPRLRPRERRGPGPRAGGRRPAGRARRARPGRDGGRQPDAVLRRGGRPDRRHRHAAARPGAWSRSATPRRRSATSTSTSAGSRAARSRSATRSSSRSTARAAPACAAPTPRPTCCTRRCAATSARTSPRRARWSPPTACASTSATPSR